jgi:D-xylose transport system permease protein
VTAGDVTAGKLDTAPPGEEPLLRRIIEDIRGGNVGSWPVVFVLLVLVLLFSFTAPNFFSAVNFNNIIDQMTATTLLAFGIVFVLLIGEIDLSVAFVSGFAGVIVAELQLPGSGHDLPGIIAILAAVLAGALIGAGQGSIIALVGVPSFVVTLAGFEIWQGAIQRTITQGVLTIQDNTVNNMAHYFFSEIGGWIIAAIASAIYVGGIVSRLVASRRHGVRIRDPLLIALRILSVPALAFGVVAICNTDRGVPFELLLVIIMLVVLTFLAKRTTFGRHVYAVGGNAEAARRAGINVARIRILVFTISGTMAGLGGVVLAARLSSADLNQGGGTLLIDAIAAAVIGGTSLFGGRGEVRNALLGALVIAVINNGLAIIGWSQGVIFIVTGLVLLLAVTLDTVLRRLQAQSGR